MTEMEEHLEEELHVFQKEKERIRDIVGQLGGARNHQNKIISSIFLILIIGLLVAGLALKKTNLTLTLLIAVLVALFKLIWMIYEAQKTNHFQFWILSTLEYRINEVDKRIKKVEKLVRPVDEEKKINTEVEKKLTV